MNNNIGKYDYTVFNKDCKVHDLKNNTKIEESDEDIETNENQTEDKQDDEIEKASSPGNRFNKEQKTFLNQNKINADNNKEQVERYELKNKIINIVKSLSMEEYNKIKAQGISLDNYSIEGLAQILEEIKKIDNENQEKVMQAVSGIQDALNLANSIGPLPNDSIVYLVKNNLQPSIENIYKAQYIKDSKKDGLDQIPEDMWEQLNPKISIYLNNNGLEADQGNMQIAQWCINNNIPVNKENIVYKTQLDNIDKLIDKEEIIDKINNAMLNGTEAKDTLIIDQNKNISDLVEDIKKLSEKDIEKLIKQKKEINLNNLIKSNKGYPLNNVEINSDKIDEVSVKRQLHEIRLKLTYESAKALKDNGIEVDIEPLEKIVKELKSMENKYYQELFEKNGVKNNQESIETFKNTVEKIEDIKKAPIYIIGKTLNSRYVETLESLVDESQKLNSQLEKANQAYELLITRPTSEYGDSIKKAFQNMDTLLNELNIENTSLNQRAARILAYNSMDLTPENINQIKSYDMQLNELVKNLTPMVTMHLIKNDINPIKTPLFELNEEIKNIKTELGEHPDEKYSDFLWKLEKNNNITEEQRNTYVGIYRLLHAVDRTDGAALGSLINSNQEVNLKNLLKASNINKINIDLRINEEFGLLEELKLNKEKILDQIEGSFGEFNQELIKGIIDEITPDRLANIERDMDEAEILDFSLEKLHDKLINTSIETKDFENMDKVEEIKENLDESDAAISFLKNFNMGETINNIGLAKHVLENDSNIYQELDRLSNNKRNEKTEEAIKKAGSLSDKFSDEFKIKELINEISSDIDNILDEMILTEERDSKEVDQIVGLRKLNRFTVQLANKRFYQIPVEEDGKIANINLTIIDGDKGSSQVAIAYSSETIGRVNLSYNVKQGNFTGLVLCDTKKGLDLIKENDYIFREIVESEDISYNNTNYALDSMSKNIYIPNKLDTKMTSEQGNISNNSLFNIARQFIGILNKI
ncbi:MAG TPA: hypothetical protein GXZ90_07785 [Clostridiales bacterium]|nr:hypothetical protein [Clostridiales bacterium]